jgi:hypothetical protein
MPIEATARNAMRKIREKRGAGEDCGEDVACKSGLGKITVFSFLFFFLIEVLVFHRLQFDGIDRDHLEVGPALGARHDFPFVDLIFFDIKIVFTFWTIDHKYLHSYESPLLIFRFSPGSGQVLQQGFQAQSGLMRKPLPWFRNYEQVFPFAASPPGNFGF